MKNIPFKPLSERMLEEPFWLGLITVTIVLILIGICYLLKKNLPENFQKFITEDVEKGRLVEKSLQHQGKILRLLYNKPEVKVMSRRNQTLPVTDGSHL